MKYTEPNGLYKMEIDMVVAAEMQDQIAAASEKAQSRNGDGSKNARSKWQKRKQKRAKRLNEEQGI